MQSMDAKTKTTMKKVGIVFAVAAVVALIVTGIVFLVKPKSLGVMSPYLGMLGAKTSLSVHNFSIRICTSASTRPSIASMASTEAYSYYTPILTDKVSSVTLTWQKGTNNVDTLVIPTRTNVTKSIFAGQYIYYNGDKTTPFHGRSVSSGEKVASVSLTLPAGTTYYRVDGQFITSDMTATYFSTKNKAFTGSEKRAAMMIPVYPAAPNTALASDTAVKLKYSSATTTTDEGKVAYTLVA